MPTTTDLRTHQAECSEALPQPTLVEGMPEDAPIPRLSQTKEPPQYVYVALRDHQQQASEKLRLLHTYLPLINNRFYGGQLPLPALNWDISGSRSMASHRPTQTWTITTTANSGER